MLQFVIQRAALLLILIPILISALSNSSRCRANEERSFTEPYSSFDRKLGATFEVTRPLTSGSDFGQATGRTLVSFVITLPTADTGISSFYLTHVESGRAVPFQVVVVGIHGSLLQPTAKICFFANLNDEAQKFHLSATRPSPVIGPPAKEYALFRGMEYRREMNWDLLENSGVIDNGKFSIRMPLARRWNPYIQGPIDGIGVDGKWQCRSHFNLPDYSTISPPRVTVLEKGPLFVRYMVEYGPSIYQRLENKVTHILGYDYVIIDEAYNRFDAPGGQSWSLVWESFTPDRMHTPDGVVTIKNEKGTIKNEKETNRNIEGSNENEKGEPFSSTKSPSAGNGLNSRVRKVNHGRLAKIIPPNAPLQGWPNAAFESDSDEYVVALFALDSSSWRTESEYGLANTGVRAQIGNLTEPPEKDYGPLARIGALAADAPFEDSMRYPYRNRFKNRKVFQLDFPLDNGFRRTALAYIPRRYLNSPRYAKRISSASVFADFMSGSPQQSSVIDHHLQKMRLQATLFHPSNTDARRFIPPSRPNDDSTAKQKDAQDKQFARWLNNEIETYYPRNYSRLLTEDKLASTKLRRLYTHLMASELNSADSSSFARMNSLDDLKRHSYVLGALQEPPSSLREFWLGRFNYHNKTWLSAYLGESERNGLMISSKVSITGNADNSTAGWRGPMDSSQLAAFRKVLEWSRLVERVDGRKQFANESTKDLARFIVQCSTSQPKTAPTFLSLEQRKWLNSVAAEIEPELSRFDGQGVEKLKWWMGKIGTPPTLKSAKLTDFGISLRSKDAGKRNAVHAYQGDVNNMHDMPQCNGAISYCVEGTEYTSEPVDRQPFSLPGPTFVGPLSSVRTAADGPFFGLGPNAIRRPVYDLGSVQFGELTSAPTSPAWPSYHSRSIGLVGTDYLMIYDDVRHGELCFDWSYPIGQKVFIASGAKRRETKTTSAPKSVNVARFLFDENSGHGLTLVSHKPIEATLIRDDAAKPVGYRVQTETSNDYVFQNSGPKATEDELAELKNRFLTDPAGRADISFANTDVKFYGGVGVVRLHQNGTREAALIRGRMIDAWGLQAEIDNPDYAIGLKASRDKSGLSQLSGWGHGESTARIRVSLTGEMTPPFTSLTVWSGGKKIDSKPDGAWLQFEIPAGRHEFVIAPANAPQLIAPKLRSVETVLNKARITWPLVKYADSYRIELSQDGLSFTSLATTASEFYEIAGLREGARFHVRVVPLRKGRSGEASDMALVHITNQVLEPPAGLAIDWLDINIVALRWGQVLGARDYKVYRRRKGDEEWDAIHFGTETFLKDDAEGAVPAMNHPFYYDNRKYQAYSLIEYEYAVSVLNGLGESKKSPSVFSRPNSWQAYRSLRESQLIEGKLRGPIDVRDYFRYP
jgi:hypothetical protein